MNIHVGFFLFILAHAEQCDVAFAATVVGVVDFVGAAASVVVAVGVAVAVILGVIVDVVVRRECVVFRVKQCITSLPDKEAKFTQNLEEKDTSATSFINHRIMVVGECR